MKTTILLSVVAITLALPAMCSAAVSVERVPEPATGLLLLLGGAGVTAYRRLRRRRQ